MGTLQTDRLGRLPNPQRGETLIEFGGEKLILVFKIGTLAKLQASGVDTNQIFNPETEQDVSKSLTVTISIIIAMIDEGGSLKGHDKSVSDFVNDQPFYALTDTSLQTAIQDNLLKSHQGSDMGKSSTGETSPSRKKTKK